MRAASVSRFSRAPSSHGAIIRPAARRPSPYRTSKPVEEISAKTATAKRQKTAPSSFDDRIIMINKKLSSFSELEYDPNVRAIDVQKNQINSFLGLPSLKELESLDISYTGISNFSGFPILPKLRAITLTNTPLASNRNVRIALIILVGQSLRLINGERISASDRRFAASYPPETPTLLHLGWEITPQPPSASDVQKILKKLTNNSAASRKRTTNTASSSRVPSRKTSIPKKLSEAVSTKLSQQEAEKKRLKAKIDKMNKK